MAIVGRSQQAAFLAQSLRRGASSLIQMRPPFLIAALLFCECSSSPPQTTSTASPPPSPSILDETVAKYSNALAHAWQELPGDRWEESRPFRVNVSSDQRVLVVAKPMFDEIQARLKEMTVTNLVGSF